MKILYLEEFLGFDEEVNVEDEQVKERFRITDLGQATWALRKIRHEQKQINEVKRVAQEEIQRIEDWAEDAVKSHERQIEFFKSLLTEYHFNILKRDERRKTIKLPGGRLTARRLPAKYAYDDDKLLGWLEEHAPELVRVKKEPDKSELRKRGQVVDGMLVLDTGEAVEGVVIHEQGMKFDVKLEEEDK